MRMQFRGLLAGVFLLVLLAGGVWWSQRTEAKKQATATSDTPKLVSIKEEDVREIDIKHLGSPETVLTRNSDGKWQLAKPEPMRADNDAASGVVSAFTSLSWDRLVDEKASDLSPYGLQSPRSR